MRLKKLVAVGLGLTLLFAVSASAAQSLGEIARQLREQKNKEGRKPVKVYTNDDLSRSQLMEQTTPSPPEKPAEAVAAPQPSEEAVSEQQPSSAAPAETQPPAAEPTPTPSPEKKPDGEIKTKEYWQGRFSALRAQLAQATGELPLLEDELNLLQVQKAREIGPSAGDTSRPDLEAKIAAKKAEIDSKRAAADKARQALDTLKKEFAESGAPEEWSRTD